MASRVRRIIRSAEFNYFMLTWPILFLVTTIAVLLIAQRTLLSPTAQEAPDQPIAFPHAIHAGDPLNLECSFCHRAAAEEPHAGLPAVEQCMFCHTVANGEQVANPTEVQKVLDAWENYEGVDWNRVHQLPDHVQFVHEAHINAEIECATCHGDVQNMDKIKQVRDLRMDDCVECHLDNNAPIDCTTCHY